MSFELHSLASYRYSTFYTNFAVFALVMDRDIDSKTALTYPELYKDLVKGKSLSYKTFTAWLLLALFQGKCVFVLVICVTVCLY